VAGPGLNHVVVRWPTSFQSRPLRLARDGSPPGSKPESRANHPSARHSPKLMRSRPWLQSSIVVPEPDSGVGVSAHSLAERSRRHASSHPRCLVTVCAYKGPRRVKASMDRLGFVLRRTGFAPARCRLRYLAKGCACYCGCPALQVCRGGRAWCRRGHPMPDRRGGRGGGSCSAQSLAGRHRNCCSTPPGAGPRRPLPHHGQGANPRVRGRSARLCPARSRGRSVRCPHPSAARYRSAGTGTGRGSPREFHSTRGPGRATPGRPPG
jgi:hypothetical protein